MKGLILGILLSAAYVLSMVALFSSDFAKENDFLFSEPNMEAVALQDTPQNGVAALVKLQNATPAAASEVDIQKLP